MLLGEQLGEHLSQRLTHHRISGLTAPGRYFDTTQRLHLFVKGRGAKYWIYRYQQSGRRREKCLGSFNGLTLSQARQRASEANLRLASGRPPFDQEKPAERPKKPSFRVLAEKYITDNRAQWRNHKHAEQWANTLRDYAYPVIGDVPVDLVSVEHIRDILLPIWVEKTETATRLRGRIEKVLGGALALGLRDGGNPAVWKGLLEHVLPQPNRIMKQQHHPAAQLRDMPELTKALRDRGGPTDLALEFLILTAARSGEVRFATWSEFDEGLWTIPAVRMKAGSAHRIPLPNRCLEILAQRKQLTDGPHVFQRNGKPLSDVAMSKTAKKLLPGITVHGFRSTFRDWVAEKTEYPGDLAEMALAHAVSNKVEAAYRRGDMLERRRAMMEHWAHVVGGNDERAKFNFT